MKKTIRILLIMCLAIAFSGCATMTIEGDGQKTPKSKNGTHTKQGSFYGVVWSEPPAEKCEDGRNLYRVRYHTNAAYVLASAITLGIYVPQTVEWWCDGTPMPEEDEDIYRPSR